MQAVDDALAEIDRLPGRHLYFLDDPLLGHKRFAHELFAGLRGMNRVFQGAATVQSILSTNLIMGVTTSTFHIATPYPGTAYFNRLEGEGRILTRDWELYDTRHVVFETRGMRAEELEAGYHRAYRDFYRWSNIWKSGMTNHLM